MRHIKIFEQFDEWDPFGEESEIKNVEGPIIISHNSHGKFLYYVAEKIVNNKIYFFRNYPVSLDFSDDWEIVKNINDNHSINIYDGDWKFSTSPGESGSANATSTFNVNNWRKYKYKDLPQEIKNQLK